ncbi:class I SAM-dependent methyltransferase [Candidatus Oscillochloris fontis]|uniref:class I SAM-dependent methyltransferase n=1 Tax=Candidatus Oscillochloris fontis TaxID=2496868 RepID=UPI00101DB667|nr:class I SAM-dependent methyltransferase [Candidatus Oscillochloris fontis]
MNADHSPPTRLALPLSAEGYAHANEAFRQCWTADRAEVLAFMRQHLPTTSANNLHVLGFGVGDGEFDVQIIAALRAAFPTTTINYIAVEPNTAQLQRFAERMRTEAVQLTQHPLQAEEYTVEGEFDLIHYIHALYHMPGSEARLLRDALAGLRPGGKLLIALSSERGGIYQLMGQFWERIDYSFFTTGLFGQESLRATLAEIGVPYTAEIYPDVAIDVGPCFDPDSDLGRHLLNFLLQAAIDQAPEDLRQDVLDALDALAPNIDGRRLLSHPSGVFVVTPPPAGV